MALCAYCGHSRKWHHGSRIEQSDNTECEIPTVDEDGKDDECACTSFMTKKDYDAIYGQE